MSNIMGDIDKQVARMGFELVNLELQLQQAQQQIEQLQGQLRKKNTKKPQLAKEE